MDREKTFLENTLWIVSTAEVMKTLPADWYEEAEAEVDLPVEENIIRMRAVRKEINATVHLTRRMLLDTLRVIVEEEQRYPGELQPDAEKIYDGLLEELEEREYLARLHREKYLNWTPPKKGVPNTGVPRGS